MFGASKRTKYLIDLCTAINNNPDSQESRGINNHVSAPGSHRSLYDRWHVRRSPLFSAPVSPWWDGIFEAADILTKSRQSRNRETVKRKLTFHNQTTSNDAVIETHQRQAPHLKQELPTLVVEQDQDKKTPRQSDKTDAVIKSHQAQNLQELPAVIFEERGQEKRISQHTDETGVQEIVGWEETGFTTAKSATFDQGKQEKKHPSISEGPILEVQSDKALIVNSARISQDSIPVKPLFPSHVNIFQKKLALNSGTAHVNTVGKVRKARKPLKHCKDNCGRCEKPKLNESERESVCTLFWNLKEHELQWLYISDAVQLSATKKKKGSECTKGGKEYNRNYLLSVCGKRRKVCKTMFKSTLNISDSWIVSALSHCSGNTIIIPDQRGKHRCVSKLTATNGAL